MSKTIATKWAIRTYDVWGNATDGFEVNQSFNVGAVNLRIPVTTHNAGTPAQFESARPTDGQIRKVFDVPRVRLDLSGEDIAIYVNRARDGYPIGELYCESHASLSPIREA